MREQMVAQRVERAREIESKWREKDFDKNREEAGKWMTSVRGEKKES